MVRLAQTYDREQTRQEVSAEMVTKRTMQKDLVMKQADDKCLSGSVVTVLLLSRFHPIFPYLLPSDYYQSV